VDRTEDEEGLDGWTYFWRDPKNSIGKVQQWHGNAGAVVRSWAFYRRYGCQLEKMSEPAVLNANYLRHRILNPDAEVAAKGQIGYAEYPWEKLDELDWFAAPC
jgi:glycine cleavage system protein P-like pyridoxal-binding family